MTCPRCSSPVIHKPGSFLVIGTQSVLSYNRLFAVLELDSTSRVKVGIRNSVHSRSHLSSSFLRQRFGVRCVLYYNVPGRDHVRCVALKEKIRNN